VFGVAPALILVKVCKTTPASLDNLSCETRSYLGIFLYSWLWLINLLTMICCVRAEERRQTQFSYWRRASFAGTKNCGGGKRSGESEERGPKQGG